MSEYLRHKYSGRVYQIIKDHGPDHPYIFSPSEYSYRYPSLRNLDQFFSPCEKPTPLSESYSISISQELEWEKKQLRKENLGELVVRPPKGSVRIRRESSSPSRPKRNTHSKGGEYTLKDLCLELGITPAQARKTLRSSGKKAPDGGWKWVNPEAAEPIKRILKKS